MNYYHLPKFIQIPDEFYDLERQGILKGKDKEVLAFYKYYTEELPLHCCTLKNEVVAYYLVLKERRLQEIKSYLKELGYISVDGKCVRYLGIDENRGAVQHTPKGAVQHTPNI